MAILNIAGDRALTAGHGKDFTVRLWDAGTGNELHRWEQSRGTITGAAFGIDGDVLLTWGVEALTRLWNAQSPYNAIGTMGEGCAGLGAVAQGYLSDDGRRIVTILRNGRTDVWFRDGSPLFTLHTFPETQSLSGCGFSYPPPPEAASFAATPDLRHVLVYGEAGTLVLFELPRREEMVLRARKWVARSLTSAERSRFFLK